MGNTFNIQNRWRNFVVKDKSADSKIGSQSQCPKCGQKFNKNITYEQFDEHLQICLQNSNIITQKQQITQTEVYIKKVQKGSTKWVRHFIKIDPNIYNLSHKLIKNRTFGQKLVWFYENIEQYRIKWQYGSQNLIFDPKNIVQDSIETVLTVDLRRQLKLTVIDDKVSDAGGILRQWSSLIMKQIVGKYQLLTKTDNQQISYKLNKNVELDSCYYELLGAVIGKIIFQKVTIETHFDHILLKLLLNKPIELNDVKTFDSQLYKSWNKILQTENIQTWELTFSVISNGKTFDLIPNGSLIQVTDQNKKLFVQKCIEFYCQKPYQPLIAIIQNKLNQIIPIQDLQIFDVEQLEVIINGVDHINIADWKDGTVYREGINEKHKVAQWFWEVLEEMSQQQRGKLLKYVTGSSRLPIFGFKKLQINRGKSSSFTIQPIKYDKKNPLPKAHTCFNRLLLPLYPSKDIMKLNLHQLVKIQFDGIWGLE